MDNSVCTPFAVMLLFSYMEEKYTRDFFVRMGKKGGQKTLKEYGVAHFKKMQRERKTSTRGSSKEKV